MVYTQRRNAKLMLLMIVIVWLTSALISIPPLFGWGKPSARLEIDKLCAVSSDLKYQIYATLLAFYLPLITMIIIYINIYRAANKIRKREMETSGRLQIQSPALLLNSHDSMTSSSHQQSHNCVLPSFANANLVENPMFSEPNRDQSAKQIESRIVVKKGTIF